MDPELADFIRRFNRRRRLFRLCADLGAILYLPAGIYAALGRLRLRGYLFGLPQGPLPFEDSGLLLGSLLAAGAGLGLFAALFIAQCPACSRYIGSRDGGVRCGREAEAGDALDQPPRPLTWFLPGFWTPFL